MRLVVSVHDPPVWTIPPAEVMRIRFALRDVEVIDARDAEDRMREFPSADVIVATRISSKEFAVARRLKWIHTTAVGVGALLVPEVVASPVPVTNSRGVHSEAIAEHAIALALALRRRLHVAAARQAAREWAQVELASKHVPTLSHSTLLVVGLGTIGARVAQMGAGLGMRVIGVRKRLSEPTPPGVSQVLPPERLDEGLAAADVVVLAVPRTEETRALIGEHELRTMKRSAVLVNVARGRLIDETALLHALAAGEIAGAGLDAFQQEPLPADSPLWLRANVLITPHAAAFAGDYWAPVVELFLDNMRRFKAGEPLLNVVDKQQGY